MGAVAIGGGTTVAAVLGDPVRHSRSPALLNAAFAAAGLDWLFVAFEVPAADLPGAIAGVRALRLGGVSVTMPHKAAVLELVDRVDDDAAALGAANCLWWDEGALVASSTDGPGFVASLRAVGVEAAGRRVVVVGAGGAARAVVRSLALAGAAEVVVVNRTVERAEAAAALAGAVGRVGDVASIAGADLVVNATSLGMDDTAGAGALPFDAELLHPGQAVADLVYHPRSTPLLRAAKERGAVAVDGLGMLVHQAALAFERWTGQGAPLDAMRAVASGPDERG